jgi:hypothetical protein
VTDLQPTTKVEIVATSLRSMWEERARLVPEEVVDAAREPEHPLHGFFEWDDSEAAHRWRVWQAGQLIRSVQILVTATTNGDSEEFKIREWIPARSVGVGHGSYVPQDAINDSPERQERLLRQMRRDLAGIERRYKHQDFYYRELRRMAAEVAGEQPSE